jgi:hypothetical protein
MYAVEEYRHGRMKPKYQTRHELHMFLIFPIPTISMVNAIAPLGDFEKIIRDRQGYKT